MLSFCVKHGIQEETDTRRNSRKHRLTVTLLHINVKCHKWCWLRFGLNYPVLKKKGIKMQLAISLTMYAQVISEFVYCGEQ